MTDPEARARPARCPDQARRERDGAAPALPAARTVRLRVGQRHRARSASRPIGSPARPERDRTPEDTVDIEDPVIVGDRAAPRRPPGRGLRQMGRPARPGADPVLDHADNYLANLRAAAQRAPHRRGDGGHRRHRPQLPPDQGPGLPVEGRPALGGPLGPRRHHHAAIGAPSGPPRLRRTTVHIVTVDQGTSSTKTALWDAGRRPVAEASGRVRRSTGPTRSGREIDAERWWDALCETVATCWRRPACAARTSPRVALDGIGWTLVPVDAAFRAAGAGDDLARPPGRGRGGRAARRPDAGRARRPCRQPARRRVHHAQARLAHGAPTRTSSTRPAGSSPHPGFLVARLTGEATCDLTQAYGFHCFDIRRERWDEPAAARAWASRSTGCRRSAGAGDRGRASRRPRPPRRGSRRAPRCSWAVSTPPSARSVAGVTRPGQTQDQGGSGGRHGHERATWSWSSRASSSATTSCPGSTCSRAARSAAVRSPGSEASSAVPEATFDELTARGRQLAGAGSGGLLFLPYLAGERTPLWSSSRARRLPRPVVRDDRAADMLRAIMEGCAFAVLDNLRVAEATGVQVTEWLGHGGAARSPLWNQIKADVTGRPVRRRPAGGRRRGRSRPRPVRPGRARRSAWPATPPRPSSGCCRERTTLRAGCRAACPLCRSCSRSTTSVSRGLLPAVRPARGDLPRGVRS